MLMMTTQDTPRHMTKEEFEAVVGMVENRAEGMVDDEVHPDMDTAMEFAWEMVQDDILHTDLTEWAKENDLALEITEVSPKAVADGTKFDNYDLYVKWCREHNGTER